MQSFIIDGLSTISTNESGQLVERNLTDAVFAVAHSLFLISESLLVVAEAVREDADLYRQQYDCVDGRE